MRRSRPRVRGEQGEDSMTKSRGTARALVLCASLACLTGCGGDGDGNDQTGTLQDAGSDPSDGGQPGDAAVQGMDAAAQPGDARAAEAGGGNNDTQLDGDGFPLLGAVSNVIVVSVSNSNSSVLQNGVYTTPFSKNTSSGSTLSFLYAGLALLNETTLQVQLNLKREMKDGTLTCESPSTLLLRYGKPPSGSNQLLTQSCTVNYTYDATAKTYAGKLEASAGEGLTSPSMTATAQIRARFSVTEMP
jgi:hypothetical protein